MSTGAQQGQWVLLAYRLPREPSTPRSSVWRKLKRLGVAQLADGLVTLPADARTREALEWIAEEVVDNGGEATLWLGQPADTAEAAALAEKMNAAITAEYQNVTAQAREARSDEPASRRRVAARLQRELHRIAARDFFSAPGGETARRAVEALAAQDRTPART